MRSNDSSVLASSYISPSRSRAGHLFKAMALLIAGAAGCAPESVGVATGGRSGSGGNAGASGGAPGTGGAIGSGGSTGSGGATATGGSGSGGAMATGGNGSGGAAGAGGAPGTGGGAGGRGGGTAGSGGTGASGGTAPGTGGSRQDGGAPDGGVPDGGVSDGGGGGAAGFNPCPTTAGTACVILPLGDSITEGFASSQGGGYRVELFRQTVRNTKNITFVGLNMNGPDMVENRTFPKRHSGYGGYTINQLLNPSGASNQSLSQQAIAMYKPHIVLLKIGTNDVNGGMGSNAPTRLGALVDQITTAAPMALVVVSSIIPSQTDGTNRSIQTYNTGVRDEASKRTMAGKHVVFLDNYSVLTQNANYKTALLADNLHPNDQGYAVLGQSFYDLISALLPAGP